MFCKQEQCNGSNIADLLQFVMDEWGFGYKSPALVTDNESNVTIAAELAKLVHVKYFATQGAHRGPSPGMHSQHCSFCRKSTAASHTLKEKQRLLNLPEHKLMTDVATRWNSAHDML